MKNIFFTLAFLMPVTLVSSQVSTCDVELLDFDWDAKEITVTLNDNNCISGPSWVPTNDSVYVLQMYFSFDGFNCTIVSSNSTFSPNLGLNDTITYSLEDWTDSFNCYESAFEYYIETCEAVVGVTGANNTANIDLNSGNNWIAFNPIWDNCYNTVNVVEMTQDPFYKVYDWQGTLQFEGKTIPWNAMDGLYIIKNGSRITKHFVE